MKKNTQRLIAGLLVFLMIATLLVGVFAAGNSGDGSLGPADLEPGHRAQSSAAPA